MKIRLAVALCLALFGCAYSCSQNGPSIPSVSLTWTQSTTPGITANCVYRGAAAGVYTMPAIYCSVAPITAYTDNTVTRGTTFHYAVTAKKASTEGGYSNDVTAAIPLAPAAPALDPPLAAKNRKQGEFDLKAKVIWR